MTRRITFSKRCLMMFLVAWITFISVFGAYQQTTQAAEWLAGTVAAVGGAPLLTALLIGGVVVAGGIAIYEFTQTDAEDYQNFANGVKTGFNQFVADQEKQIALEQNQSLTDQEASDIGVANAREIVNGWWDSAVSGVKNTTSNITFNAQKYWNLYSKIIGDVADNGISVDGSLSIGDSLSKHTIFNTPSDLSTLNQIVSPLFNSKNGTSVINGNTYITIGEYYNGYDIRTVDREVNNMYSSSASGDCVPFINVIPLDGKYYMRLAGIRISKIGQAYDYNVTTGSIIYDSSRAYNSISDLNIALSKCSFPVIIGDLSNNNADSKLVSWYNSGQWIYDLSIGSATVSPIWARTIHNTLEDTHIGKSIQTGRRQLTNEGDWVGSIFKEDSIPVKKAGIQVNEGVCSGTIGWDIPASPTWDDVINGTKPYGDVVGQTGSIAVPDDVITGTKSGDRVIDYPDDAVIQDSSDYPKTDNPTNEKPEEVPDKPQSEVFDEQGGNFYPTAMDLTNIFPFCIPFDVIYLVEKFDSSGEHAPVVTIPIVYPNAIRSAMGSDSYEVVIDFQDYVAVRNVLRIFLLILFIAGLLKITRDLIRG